jgi:hypothetical protein
MTRHFFQVVVLVCLLIGGVVVPFATPATAQAGANNSSSNVTGTTSAASSGSGTPVATNVSSLRPSQAQVNRSQNATNTTNTTNGTTENSTAFAQSLKQMNSSAATQAVRQNPNTASQILSTLKSSGIQRSMQEFRSKPKKVAKAYLVTVDDSRQRAGAGSSGGGIDVVPGDGPVVPTTEEIANDTANWTEDHLLNATTGMLSTANQFVVGTIHPENSGPNGIFGTPTNEPFKSLYNSVYGPYSFQYAVLILVVLLFAMVMVLPYAGLASGGTYRATQACARIVAALVLIMFWWPIGTALAQFFDAIAMGIAPSAEELTNSMEGLFKLSVGPILASIAIYVVGLGEVLALAFVYAFRQAAIIGFQFAMPLLLVFAYAGPHRRVRSMASAIAWQYFALLTMTIPTAFFMRLGFEASWDFGFSVIANAIISMMLLGIALATPFLFSIAAFRAPPSIQSLASGAAGAAVGAGSALKRDGPVEEGDQLDNQEQDPQYTESAQYVESTQVGDRVAATDGGTNYSGATARGPGEAAGGALPGDTGVTAEQVRDFEKRTSGQDSGSAAAKTKYHNEGNIIDAEGGVVNERDSR